MNIVSRSHTIALTIIVVFIAYILVPKSYIYASIETPTEETGSKELAITEINWSGSSLVHMMNG